MDMSSFDQLLHAAATQPQPQRLLFVFTSADIGDDADAAQRARFERGQGGALAPQMCVDKRPDEVPDFAALAEESRQFGPPWQVLFAAALDGEAGRQPADSAVDQALNRMVDAVKRGEVDGFAAFDRQGRPLVLRQAAAGRP
jgi:hypothetical protein